MIIVMGHIHLDPTDTEAFTTDVLNLARATQARDGCEFFAVVPQDLATGYMLVAERWRDQASLTAHLAAGDTLAFLHRWASRMTSDVLTFEVTGGRALPA